MLPDKKLQQGILTIDKPIEQSTPILWLILTMLTYKVCIGPQAAISVKRIEGTF
jgi:hypothetical protein